VRERSEYTEFGDDEWSETNAAALSCLGDWVPDLGICARREGKSWRAQAKWRNGDGYNVGFHPTGIRDFREDVGYSPIDIVAKIAGCEPWRAMHMLRKQLGFVEPELLHFEFHEGSAWETLTRDAPSGEAPKKISNTAAEIMAANVGEPEFIVDGWLQNRKVGLLLGEDGAGKSFLLLDLAIAVATGGIWLGIQTVRAPVLLMSAEEEKRDIKVRLKVGGARGLSVLTDNLHIIGVDDVEETYGGAVLAEVDEKTRKISLTNLWHAIVKEVERVNPKLLILEPLNELFDGDEMQRRQARQFLDNLRNLARKRNMGVMLGAHPSNASMTERRPGAGSNGWNAAVRMRWWLEIVREVGDATNERKLHRMKVTGAYNDRAPIELVVGDGGWLVMKDAPRRTSAGGDPLDFTAAFDKIARDEQDFLDFVAERERQGRPASPNKKAGNYAPKEMVAEQGGTDRTKRIAAIERTMNELFNQKRLGSKVDGPPSRGKMKLVIVSENENTEGEIS
jgi:hypothetical protein